MPTYKAVAFIADDSEFTVPLAAERLRALPGVPDLTVTVAPNELTASFGGWDLHLMVDEGGYVPAEARETAAASPGYRNAAAVARCRRMAAIWSNDPDPEMDHFNDYLLSVEALVDEFRGVYAQDAATGDWFDEGKA